MAIKVSVIIPTYKRPELLVKCLKELFTQNFEKQSYEIIVVTDGPDAETCSVLDLLSQQEMFLNLHCCSLSEKKGPAAARNKGVEIATGELVVFIDDDCLPQQNWLNAYWSFYTSLNTTDAAFTGKTIVPHSNKPTDYEKNIAHLETAEFITANCAITKSAFIKVDGFDEDFPIAWREDSDMHFKLIEKAIPIHPVENAVIVHPVRKANWGVSLKEQKKSLFNALLFKKHTALYKERISARPAWNYYIMIVLFFIFLIGLAGNYAVIASVAFFGWFIFFIEFIIRRLKTTSKKIPHVFEMIVTSFFIPFLSVFWTLYGSLKYKVFFL